MLGTEWQCSLTAPWAKGQALLLRGDEKSLLSITLLPAHGDGSTKKTASVACPALDDLRTYLESGYWNFSQHPLPEGTAFQRRVWRSLQLIAPGTAVSYGGVAKQLGSSARAVANACRANPLPIIVPCHRVVAAQGVGGYMGETVGDAVAIKRWLLHHEGYDTASR